MKSARGAMGGEVRGEERIPTGGDERSLWQKSFSDDAFCWPLDAQAPLSAYPRACQLSRSPAAEGPSIAHACFSHKINTHSTRFVYIVFAKSGCATPKSLQTRATLYDDHTTTRQYGQSPRRISTAISCYNCKGHSWWTDRKHVKKLRGL